MSTIADTNSAAGEDKGGIKEEGLRQRATQSAAASSEPAPGAAAPAAAGAVALSSTEAGAVSPAHTNTAAERQMVHLQQKNKIAQMTGKKEEQEAASTSPAKLTGVMAVFSAVLPILTILVRVIDSIAPYAAKVLGLACVLYDYMPLSILEALYGLICCFFGGMYPLTIAAAETFRVTGGDKVKKCLLDIYEDVKNVLEANTVDNKKDDDGDGVADVFQISKDALATRKIALILKTVNPDRVYKALIGLSQATASVCATLKLQFVKVGAVTVSMSDQLRPLAIHYIAPVFVKLLPSDYHHWIFPLIDISCKFTAGFIVGFLFSYVNSIHAGMIGGLACSRALLRYAVYKKWTSLKQEETILDEILGWVLAALGIYFQVANKMHAPFPLDMALVPVTMSEAYLQVHSLH